MSVLRQVLLLCLLALIPAVATGLFHPKRPSWQADALKPGEVLLSIVMGWKEKVLWVDARSQKAYDQEHIPGAVLLNEDAWDDLLGGVLQRWVPGQTVIVYCDDRQCRSSHGVARRLREAGVEPVYVLKGGWSTWQSAKK